MNDILNYLQ